jgi:hypothetical protein
MRVEQAENRAEQAEVRAAAEAAGRLVLQQQLAALEAEMRRLRAESSRETRH